jgi:hypothetical protein
LENGNEEFRDEKRNNFGRNWTIKSRNESTVFMKKRNEKVEEERLGVGVVGGGEGNGGGGCRGERVWG